MAKSQNGWSAFADPDRFGGLTNVTVGPVTLGIRSGDVAVVLGYFMEQFHKRVEPLKKGQCGCFNFRQISGSSTVSNHGSATALDLNWNEHVQHKRNTFTSSQRAEMRKINQECSNVLRFGFDYSNPDDMHIEINEGEAAVKAAANKIRNGGVKPPSKPSTPTPGRTIEYMKLSNTVPVLKQGDNDDDIKGSRIITRIQLIVGATHDGVWGPETTAHISSFTKLNPRECFTLDEKLFRAIFGFAA